jgi:hypothetical protein
VEGQKFVHRHRFEIIRFHFFKTQMISTQMICRWRRLLPPKGEFWAIPGRFNGRRKPKMSARIPTVIPLLDSACPFVHQKLHLVPGIPLG